MPPDNMLPFRGPRIAAAPDEHSVDELDIRLLRAFVEVARDLSFTRAAARVGVSQPRLSMRVQALEDKLGIVLFIRTSRRVGLSEAGQRFLDAATRVIAAVDEAIAVADNVRAGRGERLTIGATAFRISERWAILHAFLASQPAIDLRVTQGRSLDLFDQVRSGAVQLAFALGPIPEDLEGQLVSSGRIGINLPITSPLAGTNSVGLDRLAGIRLGIFPPAPDRALHRAISGKLIAHGVDVIELPELAAEAMTQLIHDTGTGIVSAQWWSPEHTPGLAFVPIDEIDDALDLYIVRAGEPLRPAAAALWRIVAQRATAR